MNSSVTPLSWPVQINRPQRWLNWEAARVLNMLKGGYLFEDDPKRILQDPESLRASAVRQGSAWLAWGNLRDAVLLQMNSSDHNPAVLVGLSPQDSWELATPQFMRYYVKGGKYSNGKHGYIVSNANWDPYPMANAIEAFSVALVNMDAAVEQRIQRFASTFITGVAPADVLTPAQLRLAPNEEGNGEGPDTLFHEIAGLETPVIPAGDATDQGIGDIQSESRLKVTRAREAVNQTMHLLGVDLLSATFWMDLRQKQDSRRTFGDAPTAAWAAFRKLVPFQQEPQSRPDQPLETIAATFLRENPAARFYPTSAAPPESEHQIPAGQPRPRD